MASLCVNMIVRRDTGTALRRDIITLKKIKIKNWWSLLSSLTILTTSRNCWGNSARKDVQIYFALICQCHVSMYDLNLNIYCRGRIVSFNFHSSELPTQGVRLCPLPNNMTLVSAWIAHYHYQTQRKYDKVSMY
jgi:hypothetical protein